MRKTFVLVTILFLVLAGCAKTESQDGKPTAAVKEFNKYIKDGKTEMAYSLFSQRIKKKVSLKDFIDTVRPESKKKEIEEMLKAMELIFDSEKIDNNLANVYGTVKMPQGESYFRQKCLLENNIWKIDSEVVEDRHPDLKDYYRDIDLHKLFAVYCESLLDGKARFTYEMSSSRIKALLDFDTFAAETTNTGSKKTPREEGFKIEAVYAYSDDKGNGICIMKMGNPSLGTKDLQSGILFKLPWILENGEWKADFAKIDESFKIGIANE